jgi:excisionase family DNA binding protein
MNECLFTPRELSARLGVSKETLRIWHNDGKLRATTTKGGHRRYCLLDSEEFNTSSRRSVIYARVSSRKQQYDLQRQICLLKQHYPTFEVISDIGSGINFQRKGLQTILELAIRGNLQDVVVAHRDRLTRFGFELFEFLFKKYNVNLKVLSGLPSKEPVTELAEDLLAIVTVFTARYYGSRKYKALQKNKNISEQRANRVVSTMSRSLPLLLQQGKPSPERTIKKRRKIKSLPSQTEETSIEKR